MSSFQVNLVPGGVHTSAASPSLSAPQHVAFAAAPPKMEAAQCGAASSIPTPQQRICDCRQWRRTKVLCWRPCRHWRPSWLLQTSSQGARCPWQTSSTLQSSNPHLTRSALPLPPAGQHSVTPPASHDIQLDFFCTRLHAQAQRPCARCPASAVLVVLLPLLGAAAVKQPRGRADRFLTAQAILCDPIHRCLGRCERVAFARAGHARLLHALSALRQPPSDTPESVPECLVSLCHSARGRSPPRSAAPLKPHARRALWLLQLQACCSQPEAGQEAPSVCQCKHACHRLHSSPLLPFI